MDLISEKLDIEGKNGFYQSIEDRSLRHLYPQYTIHHSMYFCKHPEHLPTPATSRLKARLKPLMKLYKPGANKRNFTVNY